MEKKEEKVSEGEGKLFFSTTFAEPKECDSRDKRGEKIHDIKQKYRPPSFFFTRVALIFLFLYFTFLFFFSA